jgi:hypothetical protein
MLRPVRASQPGTQRVFELPVYPLYHPVGLRMVGGGELMLDSKLLTEAAPESRDELAALVRSEESWHTEACDPRGGECVRTCGGVDVPEGDGLQPAGSAVDHRE